MISFLETFDINTAFSISNLWFWRTRWSDCSPNSHFLLQVRRGVDRADIYSIALSPDVQWLAVSSDKGTVHIFSLRVRGFGNHQSSDPTAAKGPVSFKQSSSNALEPLISRSTSANLSSPLSFMKGEKSSIWTYHVHCFHLNKVARLEFKCLDHIYLCFAKESNDVLHIKYILVA